MDSLLEPATVAAMRAAPIIAVTVEDVPMWISPEFDTTTQIYHSTPAPVAPIDPGPAPLPPVEPAPLPPETRGRPSQARLALKTAHATLLAAYAESLAAHPAALALHAAALQAYNEYQEATAQNEDGIPGNPKVKAPDPEALFTHGRRGGIQTPSVVAFCKGFARTAPILLFEDSGDLTHRTMTFRSLSNLFPMATSLGGRSMGARAAARAQVWSAVKKLIFFTYPLNRGLQERYEELLMLDEGTDVLFILGDEDPLANEILLKGIRERMRARSWWVKVVGADHGVFRHRGEEDARDGVSEVAGQIAASWQEDGGRDPGRTEMTLSWNTAANPPRAEWTGWVEKPVEPERRSTRFSVNVLGGDLGAGGNFEFSLPG